MPLICLDRFYLSLLHMFLRSISVRPHLAESNDQVDAKSDLGVRLEAEL